MFQIARTTEKYEAGSEAACDNAAGCRHCALAFRRAVRRKAQMVAAVSAPCSPAPPALAGDVFFSQACVGRRLPAFDGSATRCAKRCWVALSNLPGAEQVHVDLLAGREQVTVAGRAKAPAACILVDDEKERRGARGHIIT